VLYIIIDQERKSNCLEYIKSLPHDGTICVEVKEYIKNRTTAQNRTMWMWYNDITSGTGTTPESLHREMKIRHLGVTKEIISGNLIIEPKSTKRLGVQKMTEFLEAVQALAVQLDIKIRIPDDYGYAMGKGNG